jgi:hypothetical protein
MRSKPIAVGPDRVLFLQGDAPTGIYILKKRAAAPTNRSDGEVTVSVLVYAGPLFDLPGCHCDETVHFDN